MKPWSYGPLFLSALALAAACGGESTGDAQPRTDTEPDAGSAVLDAAGPDAADTGVDLDAGTLDAGPPTCDGSPGTVETPASIALCLSSAAITPGLPGGYTDVAAELSVAGYVDPDACFGADGALVLTTANADSEMQPAVGWHLHGDGGSSWTLVLAIPGLSDAPFAPGEQITLRGRHLSTIERTEGYFEILRGNALALALAQNDISPSIAAAPDQVECVWQQPCAGRLHAVRFAKGAGTVTLGTGEVGPLAGLMVVNGYYQHAAGCPDRSSSWIWGAYAAAGGPR